MDASTEQGRSAMGIDALELIVGVLPAGRRPDIDLGDAVRETGCARRVCRLARMRRTIIFRYDHARRRVRAVGAYGLDLEQFAEAYVTVESGADRGAVRCVEDRVVEISGDVSGQFPGEHAGLFAEPVRLVLRSRWRPKVALVGVIPRRPAAAGRKSLDDADRCLRWTCAARPPHSRVGRAQQRRHPGGDRAPTGYRDRPRARDPRGRDPAAVRSIDGARRRRRPPAWRRAADASD